MPSTHPLFTTSFIRPGCVVIHPDLLKICDGEHCAAALLNQIENLCNHQQKLYSQDGELTCSHLIFSRSLNELSSMILGLYSKDRIRRAMAWMVDRRFLDKLNSPNGDLPAWKLNVEAVSRALASTCTKTAHPSAKEQSRILMADISKQEVSQ